MACADCKSNRKAANKEQLLISIPGLKEGEYGDAMDVEIAEKKKLHPVSKMNICLSLSDRLHHKNLTVQSDKLFRNIDLLEELTDTNTQVCEQLFQELRKDVYFMNMMTPKHYAFVIRLMLHLKNEVTNGKIIERMHKKCPDKYMLTCDDVGRCRYRLDEGLNKVNDDTESPQIEVVIDGIVISEQSPPEEEERQWPVKSCGLRNSGNACWFISCAQTMNVLMKGNYIENKM
jgi:hypothetical protein